MKPIVLAFIATGFTAAALSAGLLPMLGLPARAVDLNLDIDVMCQGFVILNKDLGASAAPGTPAARKMQQEQLVTAAQYDALWSLMKLTPTGNCVGLY
ncbi:hypothetical protein [Cyanobium sp. Morenito 9A2]|uniref:hypothetical protein n=1 Tax=Cyanobium sp. Morenito 9A2 TaxID=2823718 RepID=UPI0020CD9EC5|nr:hypothetical protein [Cyanobium sp. Morenito 9A2]MCP9850187.1 hypothetical protein [Cyanobium sp. Morenito 9A2]